MRFTEKISNFLDNEEEQERGGRERALLHLISLEMSHLRESHLLQALITGGFGPFPAPAAVVCDEGELGGLQK